MNPQDRPPDLHHAVERFLRVWGQVMEASGPRFADIATEDSIALARSYSRLKLLRDLRAGPMTMTQIARSLDITNAAVTGMVDRLEARRLVRRTQDNGDRRVVRVQLTTRGDALQRENHQRAFDFTSDVLQRLGPEDTAMLGAILAKLEAIIAMTTSPGAPTPSL